MHNPTSAPVTPSEEAKAEFAKFDQRAKNLERKKIDDGSRIT